MSRSQAQYSTQDQLIELRALAMLEEYDVTDLTDLEAVHVVRLGNIHGLYDAADFVRNQISGGKITLDWETR